MRDTKLLDDSLLIWYLGFSGGFISSIHVSVTFRV